MFDFEIQKSVDLETWNNDLKKSTNSTFWQTYEYLDLISSDNNDFPIFIYVKDDSGNVKGQLGLTVNQSAKAYSSPLLSVFLDKFTKFKRRATWVSGPVIHDSDKKIRLQILSSILNAVEEVAKKYDIVLINGYTPPQDYLIDEEYIHQFEKIDYNIQNFHTYVIDLNEDLDEIWDNIHKSTKRDVKKAQKRNVIVRELKDLKELDNFFDLNRKWGRTKGIAPRIVSENVKKRYWTCIESNIEKVLLSIQDGEIVAGHRLGCFNGIAHSNKIINSYSKKSNIGGPILTWHAIEWAKKKGFMVYDLSGGESTPSNERDKKRYSEQWDSLLTYKRKWGGKEYPYYHVFKVRKRKSYKLFRIISKPDMILRNYKKKHYHRP